MRRDEISQVLIESILKEERGGEKKSRKGEREKGKQKREKKEEKEKKIIITPLFHRVFTKRSLKYGSSASRQGGREGFFFFF